MLGAITIVIVSHLKKNIPQVTYFFFKCSFNVLTLLLYMVYNYSNFTNEYIMAKINTSDAFLTTKIKNDKEIETATTKNISRVSASDIQEIHQNLMRILNIKSEIESKYFLLDNFKNLVVKLKQEKKVNEEYKNYKLEAGEKALSKSEWLTQRNKS